MHVPIRYEDRSLALALDGLRAEGHVPMRQLHRPEAASHRSGCVFLTDGGASSGRGWVTFPAGSIAPVGYEFPVWRRGRVAGSPDVPAESMSTNRIVEDDALIALIKFDVSSLTVRR